MRSFFLLSCLFSVAFGRGYLRATRGYQNIVDLTESNKDLSTFLTALKAGNLINALEGEGPFTLFAPSNDAFALIPKDILAQLLDPQNVKTLDDILDYHVVAGAAINSKDLKATQELKTLQGEKLLVESRTDGVYVNTGTKVTSADNDVGNGVVHIVDRVLMPDRSSFRHIRSPRASFKMMNIVDLTESNKELSTFVTALKAGLLSRKN